MKIEFQGRTWEFEQVEITNKQAEVVRKHTGMSVSRWVDTLKEHDSDEWESRWDAMYWLVLQQNPQHGLADGSIADVDYPVYKFMVAYMEALKAENAQAEAAEPDPTRPQAASAQSKARSSRKPSTPTGGPPDG